MCNDDWLCVIYSYEILLSLLTSVEKALEFLLTDPELPANAVRTQVAAGDKPPNGLVANGQPASDGRNSQKRIVIWVGMVDLRHWDDLLMAGARRCAHLVRPRLVCVSSATRATAASGAPGRMRGRIEQHLSRGPWFRVSSEVRLRDLVAPWTGQPRCVDLMQCSGVL